MTKLLRKLVPRVRQAAVANKAEVTPDELVDLYLSVQACDETDE